MSKSPAPRFPDAGPAPDRPGIERLLEVMGRLRDPETGCPWDVKQSFATIAPYTIEEAYEVADAIEQDDMAALKGDLLLQVVFHARMAEEAGHFEFDDVSRAISEKMISRHPHVFGDHEAETPDDVKVTWEAHKEKERHAKARANGGGAPSALDGVTSALPALLRAEKLQKRAARVRFDWPGAQPVFDKIEEEIEEIKEVMAAGGDGGHDADRLEDEVGDLLFVVVNLARHLNVDAESALRRSNAKFERRFRAMEAKLAAEGRRAEDESLEALEDLWQAVKREERGR